MTLQLSLQSFQLSLIITLLIQRSQPTIQIINFLLHTMLLIAKLIFVNIIGLDHIQYRLQLFFIISDFLHQLFLLLLHFEHQLFIQQFVDYFLDIYLTHANVDIVDYFTFYLLQHLLNIMFIRPLFNQHLVILQPPKGLLLYLFNKSFEIQ